MAASLREHEPAVQLGETEDLGTYTRQRGSLLTEPDVEVPFWLLKPKGTARSPLAITPHGHEPGGADLYAGVVRSDQERRDKQLSDGDIARQAVERGFVAIAPTTRGFGSLTVHDITGLHGNQPCRSQLMHSLLVGRTAIAERVWDLERFIDWASRMPEIDPRRIMVIGNSGGGVAALYAAACDTRITIAVSNCAYASFINADGILNHCDCNIVPGVLGFGEMWDVAGLIAPRHLLTINGETDIGRTHAHVDDAVARLRAIYARAGAPHRYEHRWGSDGHRFYPDLIWPFVARAFGSLL